MSTHDLKTVLDLFLAAKAFVDRVKEKGDDVETRVRLIHDLVDRDMVNIPGTRIIDLSISVYRLRAAIHSAATSIDTANQEIRSIATADIDIAVAAKFYRDEIANNVGLEASLEASDATGKARARIQEARHYATVAEKMIEDLPIPKFYAE